MIIVIEGISAAGKTTWCAAQAGGLVVPETGRVTDAPGADARPDAVAAFWAARNVRRWQAALALEQRAGMAVCDTDPLKLHYTWGLWQIGKVGEDHWRAAVAATRQTLESGDIGFADAYFVQAIDPALARARASGDATRTRRNFALHLQLQPSLMAWYRCLEQVLPGRVSFAWPAQMPEINRAERHPGIAAFDALVACLPDLAKPG